MCSVRVSERRKDWQKRHWRQGREHRISRAGDLLKFHKVFCGWRFLPYSLCSHITGSYCRHNPGAKSKPPIFVCMIEIWSFKSGSARRAPQIQTWKGGLSLPNFKKKVRHNKQRTTPGFSTYHWKGGIATNTVPLSRTCYRMHTS